MESASAERIKEVEQMSHTCTPMPQYQSHKKVWALKIAKIEIYRDDTSLVAGAIITPAESGYAPFLVEREYITKHDPKVGGYYVVYADGYKSWTPAEPFEDGYKKV